MDCNKLEEFRQKIEKRMTVMDAKLSFINKGFNEFQTEFKDFQQEMTDFMGFAAEQFLDHDKQL
ncbi:MAG: hypothetical protein ACFB15_00365 [Cyclobacteriaceae bacterium]